MLSTHASLERPVSQLERDEALQTMWSALLKRHAEGRSCVAPPHARHDSSAISAVCDYLEANFAHNTSLETLSQLSGLSVFHLTRSFKQRYGLPPHALQTQVRLRHARR